MTLLWLHIEAGQWVSEMSIDEIGEHRVRNKNDTICIVDEIDLNEVKTEYETKTSDWNYKAAPEKWQASREEIQKSVPIATELMSNWRQGMTERYSKWEKLIYKQRSPSIIKNLVN